MTRTREYDYEAYEEFVEAAMDEAGITKWKEARTEEEQYEAMKDLVNAEKIRIQSGKDIGKHTNSGKISNAAKLNNTKGINRLVNDGKAAKYRKENNENFIKQKTDEIEKETNIENLKKLKKGIEGTNVGSDYQNKKRELAKSIDEKVKGILDEALERKRIEEEQARRDQQSESLVTQEGKISEQVQLRLEGIFGPKWKAQPRSRLERIGGVSKEDSIKIALLNAQEELGNEWYTRPINVLSSYDLPKEVIARAKNLKQVIPTHVSWANITELANEKGLKLDKGYFETTPINGKLLTRKEAYKYLLEQK
jgi:hypothetical protein